MLPLRSCSCPRRPAAPVKKPEPVARPTAKRWTRASASLPPKPLPRPRISTTRAISRCPRWKPLSSRKCSRRSTRSLSLYKKLGKLQDASVEAALASDELSTGQERRFKKLRTDTIDLVKSLKLNNNRIEALVDQMYGINRRLVSIEGRFCALRKPMASIARIS